MNRLSNIKVERKKKAATSTIKCPKERDSTKNIQT